MGASCQKSVRRIHQQCFGKWEEDPDDEWKQQNEAANQIPMYRLVYLSGLGMLTIKYHNRVSDEEFEAFLKREVGPFVYDGGRGRVIGEWDYIEYRKNMTHDAAKKEDYEDMSKNELISEFREFQKDAINQFIPHKACWDINQRGAVGETILHLCYLNNTETHRQIASHLLKLYPTMVYDIYEGADYYGESSLHIAIVNNHLDAVKLLVGKYGSELDRRATGRFFRPTDLLERKAITLKKSNYDGPAYYGEYPLAFAASIGNTDIYDYLIDESYKSRPGQGKADPNAQDSYGNTVIHMTIIKNQKVMFNHAIKHCKKPASYEIPNRAGLTPLQLSYKLGRVELFSSLLDLTSQPQWAYGSLSYVAYPLSMLDSIGPNGEPNANSALRTIVRSESTQHLKMLEDKVIKDLLRKKWQHYSKSKFYFKFFWAMLHLVLLSVAVYLRPEDDLLNTSGIRNKMRLTVEACVIFGCFAKTVTEIFEIVSTGSLKQYFKSLYEFPFKALFMLGVLCLFACVPCRFTGRHTLEDLLVIMSLPLSWSYMFFFYRGMKSLGPLIVMIGKMLAGDLMRFSIIYIIFLFTFAQVFYFLYKDVDQNVVDDFETWRGSIMSVFQLTVGEFDAVTFNFSRLPWVGHIVYIIFLLLVPVLMLSMLIAMMGRTYELIEERSLMQWNRQWAMLVLNMERSISKSILAKHQRDYSHEVKIPWKVAMKKGLVPFPVEQSEADETGRDAGHQLRDILSQQKGERRDSATIPLVKVDKSKSDDISPSDDTKHGGYDRINQSPPLITPSSNVSYRGDEYFTVRALLVIKQLPKSRAKTKKEIRQRWKWACRVVNRKNILLNKPKNALSVFNTYQKEKTILLSTRDGPRREPQQSGGNSVQGRIEPSILHYVHPAAQPVHSHKNKTSGGEDAASRTSRKKRSKSAKRNKRTKLDGDRGTSTPTQVRIGQMETASAAQYPRLWATGGHLSNSTTLTVDGGPQGGRLFPPSPTMPRFRNIIQSENNLLASSGARSKTLPPSFAEAAQLPPLRISPRPVSQFEMTKGKSKDKRRKSAKQRDGRKQVSSISGSHSDTDC